MNLGNFMIEVLMISSAASQDDAHLMIHATSPSLSALTLAKALPQDSLLFKSRRPALVPHRDPLAALVRRVMFLPWYAMSGSRSCMTVETTLAERIQFANRAQLPKVIFVDVQAGQTIQTYSASIKFVARMHGLRYLMYHYRAICYVVLTSLFWASSMGFMTVTWFIWLALAKLSPKRSLGDASGQNLPFDYKPGVCRDSGAPYLPIKQENEDESLAAVTEENTQKRDRHKVHIKVEEEEDDGSTAIKAEPDGNESFRKGHNTEKQDEMESLCSNGSAKTGGTSSGRSSNDGGSEIRQRLGRET
ncbi:hypothetical protein BROUX41_002701 [Berkeleyomyces rouxiae]|uniref:uncharacterized protein n=1 Tax=Berkeleyomyces rouxiae TaxID=2035830 RepID=UPI003B7E0DB4